MYKIFIFYYSHIFFSLLDMLATSAQHLNFVDPDNGKPYTFTKLFKSVSAFVNVTDNDVISQVGTRHMQKC
jgi:hypothetical protein